MTIKSFRMDAGKTKLKHFKGKIYTFVEMGYDATHDVEIIVYTNGGSLFTRTLDSMFEQDARSGLENKQRFTILKDCDSDAADTK